MKGFVFLSRLVSVSGGQDYVEIGIAFKLGISNARDKESFENEAVCCSKFDGFRYDTHEVHWSILLGLFQKYFPVFG